MRVCVGGFPFSGLKRAAAAFGLAATLLGIDTGLAVAIGSHSMAAEAAVLHRHPGSLRHHRHGYAVGPGAGDPPFSAVVVDANSGRELYGINENALRHPASITKVMTLYLLFEQFEKGAMNLQTPIPISEHAAAQEPSKLGIAAGDSLTAEEAIKAIVTRSANDVAVAVGEAIGHDEDGFAQMMTRKAHALGMSRTLYRNASGLPNDEQWTTAHDLTILARSLEERFPKYFHYFSTHEFEYDGETIGNHNHLLGRVDGVDGIKTGYTRASGFNLLTSVHRDGRSLVAVVMGGRTAGGRDRIMEGLIAEHIAEASDRGHTAPLIALNESPVAPAGARAPAPLVAAATPPRAPKTLVNRSVDNGEGDDSDDADEPKPPKTVAAPPPVKPPVAAKPVVAEKPAPKPAPLVAVVEPPARIPDTPSAHGWVKGPDAVAVKAKEETRVAREDAAAPAASHSGWIIQIGASDDAGKANELLSRARADGKGPLASAKPFTEKFVKDGDTFYRARFALVSESSADQACKVLRHSGFPCFATHLE